MAMDNGWKVVARVPFRVVGPPRLTSNSEVATMAYLRSKTTLPIPKLLAWSDNASSQIGCEYIIMEHVEGVQLHERWPTMNSQQRMLCIKGLGMMARDMVNLSCPAYGSIYFADSPITQNVKISLGDSFCIGPNCGTLYWNSAAGESELYGQKNTNTEPKPSTLPYRGSRLDHERLLADSRAVLEQLITFQPIQEAASPTLLHYDFHKRNIYVSDHDHTIITGIIDWQSTSIEPGFVYANEIPDFTTYGSESPFSDHDIRDNQNNSPFSNQQSREFEDARICSATYEVILKGLAKKVGSGRALDETLLSPFRYAATSWRDSAAAVRQELTDVSHKWQELRLPGSCPYQPGAEELAEHQKQYEDFETVQRLKLWLMSMLNTTSDGRIPTEAWEAAREANKAAFEQWMESAAGTGEMDEEKARALWPFDEMGPA
ncbi:MAG: hypothetical protein M1818_000471 [Claussenomyces sp. TS43310]|nr:MAG: hypothetical protein M1818_000471 [Claussenomyces sp. TS43310]